MVSSLTALFLSPGRTHCFKYQAENAIGLRSEFSTVYTMMPGTLPSAPADAPQLISQASDRIVIAVVPPADTGGPPVLRYQIEIVQM